MKKKLKAPTISTTYCSLVALVFALNLLLGGWSVNYLLCYFLGICIPMVLAWGIGLVVGCITVPVAVILWLLQLGGVLLW
jgi:hypothetical protein